MGLTACAGAGVPATPPLPRVLAPPAPAAPATLGADRVELFDDGARVVRLLVDTIAGAQQQVDAEIYEFDRRDLLRALLQARLRGVTVTVIADPTVARNLAALAELRRAGARVVYYPDDKYQIDHVKLLIVDQRVAMFGGMNWGAGSYRNEDFELRLRGPSVTRLERIFQTDLAHCGAILNVPLPPITAGVGRLVELLVTVPAQDIRPAIIDRIVKARRYIFVEMYVMTDTGVMLGLQDAAARGVQVFVLFDPEQGLNQLAVDRLRAGGVFCRFYRSRGEKLHAKAMVVDGSVLVVGSANWSTSGFTSNHELDAVVESAAISAMALERMERDWRQSA